MITLYFKTDILPAIPSTSTTPSLPKIKCRVYILSSHFTSVSSARPAGLVYAALHSAITREIFLSTDSINNNERETYSNPSIKCSAPSNTQKDCDYNIASAKPLVVFAILGNRESLSEAALASVIYTVLSFVKPVSPSLSPQCLSTHLQ